MAAVFPKKLSLNSFKSLTQEAVFKQSEVPPAPPPLPIKTLDEGDPVSRPPQGIWLELGKQYLRVVIDNRINVGRRIFRIELYDSDRRERLATFRRDRLTPK